MIPGGRRTINIETSSCLGCSTPTYPVWVGCARRLFSVPASRTKTRFQTYPGYRGELQLKRWTWGVTFGADFGIQVRRNIAVVPQIRVDWIDRVHLDTTSFPDVPYALLGLSSWVFRPGVGIRATF